MSSPAAICVPHASSSVLSLELFVSVAVFVSVFAFVLAPGGLAWALLKSRQKSAIPGPYGFPILGLLFAFTSDLTHIMLAKLSSSFNATSLMAFSVGLTSFVISSDRETAREMLNSSAFADRLVKESAYEVLFHRAMGFAPYGEYWHNLRRISTTHLLSPKRVVVFFKSINSVLQIEPTLGLGASGLGLGR